MENYYERTPQHVTVVSVDSTGSNRPSLYKSASTPGKNAYSHQKSQLKRTQSIKERITNETAKFFGLGYVEDGDAVVTTDNTSDDVRVIAVGDEEAQKWQQRRFRHLKREYGIRMDALADEMVQPKIGIDVFPDLTDENDMTFSRDLPRRAKSDLKQRSTRAASAGGGTVFNAHSIERVSGARLARNYSTRHGTTAPLTVETRQSVAEMALNTISSILHGRAFKKTKPRCVGSVCSNNTGAHSAIGVNETMVGAIPESAFSGTVPSANIRVGPDSNVNAATSATIYRPIRERNNLGCASTSFPNFRHYASNVTVEGIARADATVRKISDFLFGSSPKDVAIPDPTTMNTANATRLNGTALAAAKITLDDYEMSNSLKDERDLSQKRGSSSTRPVCGFYTLPLTSKKTLESGGARRPNFLPLNNASQTSRGSTPSGGYDLAVVTKTSRAIPPQSSMHRRTSCRSSPSVTNDDLFFDISPGNRQIDNARRPTFGIDTHDNEHLEDNRPSSSAQSHPEAFASYDRYSTGEKNTEMRTAGKNYYTINGMGHEHSILVRQNGCELDEYATPISDGLRSPISIRPSPRKTFAHVPTQVEFNAASQSVDLGKSAIKSAKNDDLRLSFLRRFEGLKNIGKRGDQSNLSGLQSLMKFKYSTRGSYFTPANGVASKKSVGSSKRSLPIFGSIDANIARQLRDESCDYRPFFTFWITTVQVLVMIVMLMRYGIGTDFSNLFGVIERSGDVTSTFLSMIHIVVWEQNNVWVGPRFADLVHAGAKYTPCMRQDANIYEQILRERREEALNTGCCIVGAEGICFQGSECPKQFAKLLKWSNISVNGKDDGATRTALSRVVCGQDPRYCLRPQSVSPFEWSRTDISKWPTCEERRAEKFIPRRAEHMHCEVTGRPCCIQMHGQCRITTREYCAFVRGYFHANATLCSQVSCLNSVCGMTPFFSSNRPDQIYRLITPLFIHAGIIRCLITVLLQMMIMRNFEVMIGWLRLSIIYFISGIGGYLASAAFVPYMPEVGPAGSQGGVLGALIVNVLYNWNFLRNPTRTLAYHLAIAASLFLTGLLPFVDNWAQLFGFVFGCFLSAALIPYIVFGKNDNAKQRNRRLLIVAASLTATILLFLILFTLFYAFPSTSFINYDALSLLNCPFSGKVCEQQGLFLRSWLPI